MRSVKLQELLMVPVSYTHLGRDAKDASGEPYPILHLKLGGIMKIENWGLVPYSEAVSYTHLSDLRRPSCKYNRK